MSESRQYELIYVLAPDVGDERVSALHAQVQEIVEERGGQIEKTDSEPPTWGRRRMAYEIGRYKEGIYVLELVRGPGEIVGELDRQLKVADNVLRYLIVRVDEDLRKSARVSATREAQRQRRRAARGITTPEPVASAASDESGKSVETASVSPTESSGTSSDTAPQLEVKE
jgi:small subunit ribosomal protein S6